jgi:hypothetical protein
LGEGKRTREYVIGEQQAEYMEEAIAHTSMNFLTTFLEERAQTPR